MSLGKRPRVLLLNHEYKKGSWWWVHRCASPQVPCVPEVGVFSRHRWRTEPRGKVTPLGEAVKPLVGPSLVGLFCF